VNSFGLVHPSPRYSGKFAFHRVPCCYRFYGFRKRWFSPSARITSGPTAPRFLSIAVAESYVCEPRHSLRIFTVKHVNLIYAGATAKLLYATGLAGHSASCFVPRLASAMRTNHPHPHGLPVDSTKTRHWCVESSPPAQATRAAAAGDSEPLANHPRPHGLPDIGQSCRGTGRESSPPARATREAGQEARLGYRIIPARTGYTFLPLMGQVRFNESPPHARATRHFQLYFSVACRIIPARTGYPMASIGIPSSTPNHPHPHGLPKGFRCMYYPLRESSPPARATRNSYDRQIMLTRIIPTRTGYPLPLSR